MNSRPLLDYLADPDDMPEPQPVQDGSMNTLEARLREIEARLLSHEAPRATRQEQTLSDRIEAILKRKASPPAITERIAEAAKPVDRHPQRVAVEPPPTVPISADNAIEEAEFRKFTEAVYLIGQAARRFIGQSQPAAQPRPEPVVPSTGEIEALSAVLRETVSAFRSVADDLAVSAGEIRNVATRGEHVPPRRMPASRLRDEEDEILELRDGIADLQDRLDMLLRARRRARY